MLIKQRVGFSGLYLTSFVSSNEGFVERSCTGCDSEPYALS